MKRRFCRPNIQATGRLIRAGIALVLACGALLALPHLPWLAALLGLSSAFVLFEACRGWCALRACGIKTRF